MRARAPKFEIYSAFSFENDKRKSEWHWRLVAGNGEIQASGEGHTSKRDAHRAVEDLKASVLALVANDLLKKS